MADKLNIIMKSQEGVTLHTEGMYCDKDFVVIPMLDNTTPAITPTTEEQTITPAEGCVGIRKAIVDPISGGYDKIEGSITITENQTVDVTDKAELVVSVPTAYELETLDNTPENVIDDSFAIIRERFFEPISWKCDEFIPQGAYIWSDGTNIYYSDNGSPGYAQYRLNGTTWEPMVWDGLSPGAINIWSDGTNFYHSSGNNHYRLNGTTWEKMNWDSTVYCQPGRIWTDGTNIYYSDGTDQYRLNGTTWEPMTWSGLTSFDGAYIWTDGTNIYYSNSTDQYKLNGTTWEPMAWNGLTGFRGTAIWTDGRDYYCSSGTDQYRLNGTTWEPITWSGLTSFYGMHIWSDCDNVYYSGGSGQYILRQLPTLHSRQNGEWVERGDVTKVPEVITFAITSGSGDSATTTTCAAREGMTWGEYVYSAYNDNIFFESGLRLTIINGSPGTSNSNYIYDNEANLVEATDTIIANHQYELYGK